MSIQEVQDASINNEEGVIHCVIDKKQNINSNWQNFLAQQTVLLNNTPNDQCFYFHCDNTDNQVPNDFNTLLEQMSWVLLSNPSCDGVVWPLFTSIDNKKSLAVLSLKSQVQNTIAKQGYVALSCAVDFNLLDQSSKTILCFSQALIAEQQLTVQPFSLLQRLKNKLTLEQKIFLKSKVDALRELLRLPSKANISGSYLAHAKTWKAEFIRPHLVLNHNNIDKERIPVLIATHWLELGGAEKFAIDLIKALPKEQYAVYVTTDVASFNHWESEIVDQVEAVFHLPVFLTRPMMTIFYEYLIRTRNIQLMHLHHAAQAYESLYHIRRFHPQLQILDSLHIVELPPNEGGYVEASVRNFEAFINHHHVISHYLKHFLMQRWQVPKDKISVTYLNVDSDYFNPERVEKGQIRKALNISEDVCLIGFLGRFSQQKQPLEFIKTAQLLQKKWVKENRVEPLVFLMVGSGLLEAEIKQAIKNATDTTILLHPQVQDTRPVYQDCDVMMMPSENEGLALVSYEAMAMQTLIFFTDVAAQDELMQAEFLIENKDPLAEKFVDAMWPYLIDSERTNRAGIELRRYILDHHRHEQTTSELLSLYQQLLKN